MNILITSAGTRNKVVEYFKREIGENGCVIATDMSDLAPAIYLADRYYLVPRIDDPCYIDKLLEICVKENIDCLFALILIESYHCLSYNRGFPLQNHPHLSIWRCNHSPYV